MGYGKKIYADAVAELERRKKAADELAAQRLEDFYAVCPRAQEVRAAIAANASGAARAVLRGGDIKAEMKKLQERAAQLNAEYDRLLEENGFSRADVTPRYACPSCKDTGFIDGRMCTCLKQLQRSIAYERLSMNVPLERSTFAAFSLEYYSGDERAHTQMSKILDACKRYAAGFKVNSPSLLFKGGTGLGKTHLSLAIAGEVLEKGFGVIYGSVQSFAVALEKERFDRRDEDDLSDTHSQLVSCDLLILDDLGTEFPSTYVNAALYDIINTRLLAEKPTIISTNLSMDELSKRYSERFASRITGFYGKMEFLGSDIRVESRKRGRA